MSGNSNTSRLATFTGIGKDLVALLRDGALFFLAVLLVIFPARFNSILVDAGFEEGSLIGFKWKNKLVESNEALTKAEETIVSLQTKNDELLKALSDANSKINDPALLARLSTLEDENKILKSETKIVQRNVSETIEANIPFVAKAKSSERSDVAVSVAGAFQGYSCGVSSYGESWAESTRQRVRDDLYSIYGCSEPPEAHSKEGYGGDFHTPTRPDGPWKGFAAKSVVLYYSESNRERAEALAKDLTVRYGHRFSVARGGGQGIKPDWYSRTIVIHIREIGS